MKVTRVCSVEDCEGLVCARGWCPKHYQRWRLNEGGTPVTKTCSIEGCDNRHKARGLCLLHYSRANPTQYKHKSGAQKNRDRIAQGIERTPAQKAALAKINRRRSKKLTARRYKQNIKFISEMKIKLGCSDCGYNAHPAALDFDHLPGGQKKRKNVSLLLTRTRGVLLTETSKCEVVCANCHRIRTWQRRRDQAASDAAKVTES